MVEQAFDPTVGPASVPLTCFTAFAQRQQRQGRDHSVPDKHALHTSLSYQCPLLAIVKQPVLVFVFLNTVSCKFTAIYFLIQKK